MKAYHNQIIFRIGDTIEVHYKLIEKEIVSGRAKREKKEEIRERTQVFAGIVIAMRGQGENKTFTVRKIASNRTGVERIYPLASPWITKIKVVKSARVRRAKLYYLRKKVGKEAENLKDVIAIKPQKTKHRVKKGARTKTSKTTVKSESKQKKSTSDDAKK